MKRLIFSGPEAKERYNILYEGITGTTRGFQAPSETRVIGRVLDKMEAIGTPTEVTTPNGTIMAFTLGGDGTVDLEDAEFGLMNECLQAVRWSSKGARRATNAIDWFLSASEPTSDTTE